MNSIQGIFGKDDRSNLSPLGSQRRYSQQSSPPPPLTAFKDVLFILFVLIFAPHVLRAVVKMKNWPPDEETYKIIAYHEAGHTLVAYYTSDARPLREVTITPLLSFDWMFSFSFSETKFNSELNRIYLGTVSQLRADMDVAMGGRAAEEVFFGPDKVTTGASDDLVKATHIATDMITSYGMSDKVGQRVIAWYELAWFVLSPAQRETIDSEIRCMLQESYERAKAILTKHNAELHALAEALMKYKTLDKDEIRLICEGKELSR